MALVLCGPPEPEGQSVRITLATAVGLETYIFLYMERSLGSWGWLAVIFRWKW